MLTLIASPGLYFESSEESCAWVRIEISLMAIIEPLRLALYADPSLIGVNATPLGMMTDEALMAKIAANATRSTIAATIMLAKLPAA